MTLGPPALPVRGSPLARLHLDGLHRDAQLAPAGTLSSEQHAEFPLHSKRRDDLVCLLVGKAETHAEALMAKRRGTVSAEEFDHQVVRPATSDEALLVDQLTAFDDDELSPF